MKVSTATETKSIDEAQWTTSYVLGSKNEYFSVPYVTDPIQQNEINIKYIVVRVPFLVQGTKKCRAGMCTNTSL